ncbi:hypothetical protein K505DRAFT_367924 [Melanomma pulvis-pyrius CBS 109.77]|uniref:Uncharacterized protein n=1 Tax=Melanomma pulvis-pyrius CBS 109.77 TaxID=1314802 RepID=A0A6A6WRS3_9PLEO|nr:hypothetical protein K505DRAFT_367924 [Melanomma pulvis-pyrius CBS 109.77]
MVSPTSALDPGRVAADSASGAGAAEFDNGRSQKDKEGIWRGRHALPGERTEGHGVRADNTRPTPSARTTSSTRPENRKLRLPPLLPREKTKPRAQVPNVALNTGSANNPIDVEALQSTWDTPVPMHKVKATRAGSRPGVEKLVGMGPRLQRSFQAPPSFHRAVATRPMSQNTGAPPNMASSSYQAAGLNIQKIHNLLGQQHNSTRRYPNILPATYRHVPLPSPSPRIPHPTQPPPGHPLDSHNPQYLVGPRLYPPPVFSEEHPKGPAKHIPWSAPVPTNYVKSNHCRSIAPTSKHDPNSLIKGMLSGDRDGEELKKRIVPEYLRPRLPNRGIFEDPEGTVGQEGDTGSVKDIHRALNSEILPDTYAASNVLIQRTQPARQPQPSTIHLQTGSTTPDAALHLVTLRTQTQLLVDLFHVYPSSSNKTRLREDITMLVSAQNQRFDDWLATENHGREHKKAKISDKHFNASMRDGRDGRSQDETEEVTGKENEGIQAEPRLPTELELEVQKFLPSSSSLWDKSDGMGVAHVYATSPARSDWSIIDEEEEETEE